VDQYIQGWRAHPAFAHAWDEDVEAYARYDMVEDDGVARCAAAAAAVRTDTREMVLDEATRTALDRAHTSVQLLRAEHGLFDGDPLIPADALHAFAASHPSVRVEEVRGVNHYTLVMGNSPGPRRVAAAINALLPCSEQAATGPSNSPPVAARSQHRSPGPSPLPSHDGKGVGKDESRSQ
jgi:hypothetical protein